MRMEGYIFVKDISILQSFTVTFVVVVVRYSL